MKQRILIAIAVLGLVGFTVLGISNINITHQRLQLRQVQLQDTGAKLKLLNQQYNELLKTKQVDQQQLNKLEREKQALQQQLQAKAEERAIEQQKIATAATFSAQVDALDVAMAHTDLLKAAGIAQNDWQYADYIVMHEGHYDPCVINGGTRDCSYATNGGQKAYGVCQALPGSKMASAGKDWATNPVTQLKWCAQYSDKYGGWAGSYAYWISNQLW